MPIRTGTQQTTRQPLDAGTAAHGGGGDGERGGATAVEMALLWVALLGLILAVVQIALVFYAAQLALTAAQDGVRTGRTHPTATSSTSATGAAAEQAGQLLAAARRDAEEFLARAGGPALGSAVVTAELDPAGATVRVSVTGHALSVLPGVQLAVTREAVGGVEQATP